MMEVTSSTPPIARISFEGFEVNQVQLRQSRIAGDDMPKYSVDFKPSGRVSWGHGRFELRLQVSVESKPDSLAVELDARSYFTFDASLPPDDLHQLFIHNTLSLTFPYVRAYLSALTALSGLATVTMPTFNLTSYAKTLESKLEDVGSL